MADLAGVARNLMMPGIARQGGRWAYVVEQSGLFAATLATLLGPEAERYPIEREALMEKKPLGEGIMPPLDGLLLAQTLHTIPFELQQPALLRLSRLLAPDATLLLVEDAAARGNLFTRRFPVDYDSFEHLASLVGLRDVRRLAIAPITAFSEWYSASALR